MGRRTGVAITTTYHHTEVIVSFVVFFAHFELISGFSGVFEGLVFDRPHTPALWLLLFRL